ncbi:unnamed protein product, partial [Discosporangium mesarthrocarpum]
MEEVSGAATLAFPVVKGSAGRCIELTAGYQMVALLREVSSCLSSYLQAILRAARATKSLCGGVFREDGRCGGQAAAIALEEAEGRAVAGAG